MELTEFLGEDCMNVDVNSMKPLDNLCHPVSVIRDAEELAAEAFGAANAFFMVGGTTSAVQSMIMYACKSGDKIIMPRNVHRSAINALILTGAVPVYVNPDVNNQLGIALGMSVEQVEKAIRDSGLGLNPMTAGGVIRLNMPPLTEERRRELTKVAGKYAEEAKISMRNIRQDAMGKIKRAVTDKEISEDDQRKFEEDLQKVFDKRGTEVDAMAKEKEADIMSV